MVIALVSGSSGTGSSRGRGHCVVFLERHLTLTLPLHSGANVFYKLPEHSCIQQRASINDRF